MSTLRNVSNNLDKDFENFNYLPQKLGYEDLNLGLKNFFESLNFSLEFENGNIQKVPIYWIPQELWAERKQNWKDMRNEHGEEITRPYITLGKTGTGKGTAPTKRTIPKKMKFQFLKVPKFDGTLKGYDVYKISQPTWVDVKYDLMFVTHYQQDVDAFHELIQRDAFSDGQAYLKINGYNIPVLADTPSDEDDFNEITSERLYQITYPLLLHGKLIDPTKFQKINTITKISIKISEK